MHGEGATRCLRCVGGPDPLRGIDEGFVLRQLRSLQDMLRTRAAPERAIRRGRPIDGRARARCYTRLRARPRSSGDRARASGARCAGSNPAEGTRLSTNSSADGLVGRQIGWSRPFGPQHLGVRIGSSPTKWTRGGRYCSPAIIRVSSPVVRVAAMTLLKRAALVLLKFLRSPGPCTI